MSTREFFAKRLASEVPAFLRVIHACPSERLDYRPHERGGKVPSIYGPSGDDNA